jgi:hypothetical protein
MTLVKFWVPCSRLEVLPSESTSNLIRSPVDLHLSSIYILIDSNNAIVNIIVFLLALLKNFENEVATNGRIVCVAKMLVNALLQSFDTLTKFLGIVGVN